jgi:hypothetical protein
MKPSNHWHFPRPKLAQAYLQSFELGLSAARGLFARRRMGKTEFLKQDFIPAAQAAGYVAVYVNLWEQRSDPGRALVAALYEAIEPTGFAKVLERLKHPVKKVKASGKLPGVGEGAIEAEFAEDKATFAGSVLREAMRSFDKTKIKVVLLIDEAQVLAREENTEFAHALRAALDVRKERIKVLFAGSSEATLRRMFGRPSEPFYNWAALEPFELLSRDFVEAMVEKVAAISRHPLGVVDALKVYEELKRTPEFFRTFLDRYLTHPFDGIEGALEFTKKSLHSGELFQRQWNELLPADKAVLALIAGDGSDIYGKRSRDAVARGLGLSKTVDNSVVQNALRRLSDKALVTSLARGRYQIEDEAFADWIRELDMAE